MKSRCTNTRGSARLRARTARNTLSSAARCAASRLDAEVARRRTTRERASSSRRSSASSYSGSTPGAARLLPAHERGGRVAEEPVGVAPRAARARYETRAEVGHQQEALLEVLREDLGRVQARLAQQPRHVHERRASPRARAARPWRCSVRRRRGRRGNSGGSSRRSEARSRRKGAPRSTRAQPRVERAKDGRPCGVSVSFAFILASAPALP